MNIWEEMEEVLLSVIPDEQTQDWKAFLKQAPGKVSKFAS